MANFKTTFGECALLAGKALTVNMLEVNCFQTPTVTQLLVSQHKAHMREMVNYSLIDVTQVYRVKYDLGTSGDHIVPRILTVDYTFNITTDIIYM